MMDNVPPTDNPTGDLAVNLTDRLTVSPTEPCSRLRKEFNFAQLAVRSPGTNPHKPKAISIPTIDARSGVLQQVLKSRLVRWIKKA